MELCLQTLFPGYTTIPAGTCTYIRGSEKARNDFVPRAVIALLLRRVMRMRTS
jgi:hypothetical protein